MESNIRLSAVILSAGYSSRMGAFKPLLRFGEITALELLINTYQQCGIYDIIVVLGYKADEIMKKLEHLKVKWVINENFNDGMYSSVKAGVAKIQDSSEGFFLNPVDIPLIKMSTLESIKTEFFKNDNIIYPTFNGKRGHPPLITTRLVKPILEDSSNSGLRYLLDSYEERALEVPVIDWGSNKDMDIYEDYVELKRYYDLSYVPNDEECNAIWSKYKLPFDIIEHCRAVCCVACNIGQSLIEKGYILDMNKIKSAALLHDIGRMEKKHEEVGASILRNLGYCDIANIVLLHMDIGSDIKCNDNISEDEIVYLADKLVIGKEYVSLEERFQKSLNKFKDNPEAMKNIALRLENSRIILNKIKKITGDISFYECKNNISD